MMTLTTLLMALALFAPLPSDAQAPHWSDRSRYIDKCPSKTWVLELNPETNEWKSSIVCCNPYGSNDGVEDGYCVTRSIPADLKDAVCE